MPIKPATSRPQRLAAWIAAALLAAALAFPAGARPKRKPLPESPEIAARQADLAELRGRIETLRKDVAAGEGHKAHASDRLRESEREISILQRDLHELAGQHATLRNSLKDIQQQAESLESTLAQQQAQLERLLLRQYMRGSPEALQLLLNGGDPSQMARDIHYLSIIGRSRAELLGEIQTTLARKQSLAEETREQLADLAEVEAEQKARHIELTRQRAQRRQVLAEISSRVAGQRREIGSLQQDEKRMTQLVERLSRLLAARAARAPKPVAPAEKSPAGKEPPAATTVEAQNRHLPTAGSFVRQKGSLRLPVRGAIVGRFGAPREGAGTWKGLFIRAAEGSEVRAVADGRVVFAEWMRGFGNLLIVDHGEAWLSIYGNNDALLKQVGDAVRGGENIASVGNSGGNPETGLYFEIRHQGQPLDPLKWASLK